MINNIKERKGPAFNDGVWFTRDGHPVSGTVVGNVGEASLVVGDQTIDKGRIEFVPTVESGRPSRAMVFQGKDHKVVMEQITIKS